MCVYWILVQKCAKKVRSIVCRRPRWPQKIWHPKKRPIMHAAEIISKLNTRPLTVNWFSKITKGAELSVRFCVSISWQPFRLTLICVLETTPKNAKNGKSVSRAKMCTEKSGFYRRPKWSLKFWHTETRKKKESSCVWSDRFLCISPEPFDLQKICFLLHTSVFKELSAGKKRIFQIGAQNQLILRNTLIFQ